jgi:hypothetical protein
MLLTLASVRSRKHSCHFHTDSCSSIPVTRSTREKRYGTIQSGAISRSEFTAVKSPRIR